MSILVTSITNNSIIKPAGFYVIGFTDLKMAYVHLIFLGAVLVVTVLGNSLLLYIIWLDNRLHTPKYIAVANLCVVDLVCNTSFIPSSINTVVTSDTFMSYNTCLTQMFFNNGSLIISPLMLSVLAYDRLIAICFPLRHSSINTPSRMICILAVAWLCNSCTMLFLILSIGKLSYCDSLIVNHFNCEITAVLGLSCSDSSWQWAALTIVLMLFGFVPLGLIIMSYGCILSAVFRMKHVENRHKALATFTEHSLIVAMQYLPDATLYITELFSYQVDPTYRKVFLSLSASLPSCLNPIVYSLATKEMRNRIFTLLHKHKISA